MRRDGCCDLQWVNNANYVIPNFYLLVVPCSWQSPIISKPLLSNLCVSYTCTDENLSFLAQRVLLSEDCSFVCI